MNSQHKKTLASIFKTPVPKNILFSHVESLLLGVGCEIIEGNGSRVAFKMGIVRLDVHRPHPEKEAKPYQIRDVKSFLETIGVRP